MVFIHCSVSQLLRGSVYARHPWSQASEILSHRAAEGTYLLAEPQAQSGPAKRLVSKHQAVFKFPPLLTLHALTLAKCSSHTTVQSAGTVILASGQKGSVKETRFLARLFHEWNKTYVIKCLIRHLVCSLTLLRVAHFTLSHLLCQLQLSIKHIKLSVYEVKHFYCDITTLSGGLSC